MNRIGRYVPVLLSVVVCALIPFTVYYQYKSGWSLFSGGLTILIALCAFSLGWTVRARDANVGDPLSVQSGRDAGDREPPLGREFRYRTLFDLAPDLMSISDPETGVLLDVNQAFASWSGYSREEMLGKSTLELGLYVDPDDRQSARKRLEGGDCFHEGAIRIRRKNGEIRDVFFSSRIVESKGSKLLFVVARDVTERNRMEAALRESEERFRKFADEVAFEGIIVHDGTRILDVNRRFAEMYGYERSELIGKNLFETLTPTARRIVEENIRQKYTEPYEVLALRKDGSIFPVEVNAKSIPYRGGTARGAAVRDLTERKRAEDALRQSEEKYRELVENANSLILRVDSLGHVTFFNEFAQRFFGYSEQEILGRNIVGTLVDEVESTGRDLKELMRTIGQNPERYTNVIFENARRNGERAWIAWAIKPIRGGDDELLEVLCIGNDITARRLAEEKVKESEQLLRSIIQGYPIPAFVIDNDHKVMYWNRALEELSRVKAEEVVGSGMHWKAFYAAERPCMADLLVDGKQELIPQWYAGKYSTSGLVEEAYEATDFFPDLGREGRWLRFTAAPIRDSRGTVIGAITTLEDITRRKQAEDALMLAEEEYRSIFENALEGMYRTTMDGRILSANPAFAHMLGFDSIEELKETVSDIGRQLYVEPPRRAELLRLAVDQGAVHEFEAQFYRKDGSIAWVTLNVRAVRSPDGEVAYLEGTVQDVTDRKILESRLLQAHKMEAIGTLAGGIAHDFNNILAAIIGFTELAEKMTADSETRGFLSQVLKASERAKNLVGQILTFSRQVDQEIRPVDMKLVVREALKFMRATIAATIEIRQKVAQDTKAVLADPTQIHQILINLCANAAHAMRERGGVLEVRLGNVDIVSHETPLHSELNPGPYVKLTVTDTGAGIAEETVHRIFDPFFTTKKTGEGTGLGLSVVYGIVKTYGGAVSVQSRPGEGSEFCVYLPAIRLDAEPAEAVSNVAQRGHERILLVDDEEVLVALWRRKLEDAGYSVVATTDSYRALELFRCEPHRFDLVMTDMTMPGMTGSELSKAILALRPDIPIILCTGFNELISEDKAGEIGIRAFAMKPLNTLSLLELIRKVLGHERPGIPATDSVHPDA